MREIVIKVNGMSCNHCKNSVEKALKAVTGVKNAVVNLAEKNVSVTMEQSVNIDNLYQAIEDAGYDPVKN